MAHIYYGTNPFNNEEVYIDRKRYTEYRNLIENLKKNERYKDFTYLTGGTVLFSELFKESDIPVVQIHDATEIGDGDIVGFSGSFRWDSGRIRPLDGDTYVDPEVIGYEWFEHKGKKCLDIIAVNW